MNHKNKMKNMTPAELSASAQERFVADHRRHHRMVTFMRFFILLIFLAVWELCADLKIIDSFSFPVPAGWLPVLLLCCRRTPYACILE